MPALRNASSLLYRGSRGDSLSVAGRAAAVLAAVALAGCGGGCSYSIGQAALANAEFSDASDVTGSITPPSKADDRPAESDMTLARRTASDVLSRGGKDVSLPWENPKTGARGTVTPLASAYTTDGRTCRDFLASYVKGQAEAWLQGAACKADGGRWEVRSMQPWKRS